LTLASAYGAAPPPPLADRTPENWRDLLLARLAAQRFEIAVPEAYYNGDHPLQFATSKFREAFGSLFAAFADNWCPIVVDAPVERLAIIGFRFGDGTSGDEDAWRIWQRSSLDVESVIAHTEAGKCGRAYLLVDPNDGDPRITVEHASQVVVACDPASRRRRLAALKQWWGDDGFLYATLYLPDFIFKWQSADAVTDMAPEIEWVPRRDENDGPNPFGEVPVIELQNTPGLMRGGESDLKPAMPIQNAVNKLCTDMLVASEFGAFRQRVLTCVEITTPHYLIGQVVNASGDALKAAEAGLTSKCRRKILYFSDPWEDAMALALRAVGRNVDAADGEVLWADPEQRSLGEVTDALVKKRTLGVPLEQIWLEMGYTPAQVTDLKRQAGLPERPPAGATTAALPPVLGGSSSTPDAQQQ
jgi:hypothetical protein